MMHQEVTPRTALVVILAAIYAILLLVLIASSRRESDLAIKVTASEAALRQATGSKGMDVLTLRSNLAAARERQAALEARLPREVESAMFDRVAQDAQLSGITDFRYQRKGEFMETMQAGTYKVYRYTIAGRGSQDKLGAFLDGLQAQSGPTMLIENVSLTAVGKEWQLNADITVHTWGG